MDTINYCDFSIICRICLTKCGSTFTSDAIILNIFHKLTNLDFQTEDLPQQICLKCFDKINEIHRFSFQCKRSHSALVECLNQQRIHEPKVEIVYVICNDISDEYDNHIIEDEVEKETTTNSDIFENLDRLKTEELKEEIPDVISDEDEVEGETTTNSEINKSLYKQECKELQVNILVPNVKEVTAEHKCEQCPQAFKYQYLLVQHKRIHSGERPYKCDQCSKSFTQQSNLMQHKHTHSGKRSYTCNQCSKTFSQSSTLSKHKRIHSSERPYKCDQCPKTFKHQSHLTLHNRIHSDERPYKCDQCSTTFKYRSNLMDHKRIHSGERPYKCEQCSKTFARQWSLIEHARVHKSERTFKCDQMSKNL